ncbi:hypothetical protein [Biostraticola tofi]|uniref:Uncharacterized protein n=1 Tax=Biostraticola tofi TaxID=466109 RepID=A0A4R3Z5D7_9GAMM|nr:hypothetical protein [Biostraticola tofi]TCW00433.1 hypothetical protein EDC52_101783 [Biostraticola tofi]
MKNHHHVDYQPDGAESHKSNGYFGWRDYAFIAFVLTVSGFCLLG